MSQDESQKTTTNPLPSLKDDPFGYVAGYASRHFALTKKSAGAFLTALTVYAFARNWIGTNEKLLLLAILGAGTTAYRPDKTKE